MSFYYHLPVVEKYLDKSLDMERLLSFLKLHSYIFKWFFLTVKIRKIWYVVLKSRITNLNLVIVFKVFFQGIFHSSRKCDSVSYYVAFIIKSLLLKHCWLKPHSVLLRNTISLKLIWSWNIVCKHVCVSCLMFSFLAASTKLFQLIVLYKLFQKVESQC